MALMTEPNSKKFIPGGLWAPMPLSSIKYLNQHHRPADRVLYALCLHLGVGLQAVFPSYPTVANYASVAQKSLRANYDKLVELGFISIEKKRVGKRFKNYYTILPKAWTFRSDGKSTKRGPSLDPNKRWMCSSCDKIVPIESTEFIRHQDWEGNNSDQWIHTDCEYPHNSRLIRPILWWMMNEEELENLRRDL